jgi:uncharacterized membrane protein
MTGIRTRLRRYFITGLVVITPIGATWFMLSWLFRRLDAILGVPLQGLLPIRVPGLGLLLLLLLILAVGWLAYQTAGRQLIHAWDGLLGRFPLTAKVYRAATQIVQTIMGSRERLVRRVVLVPFPTEGSWMLGFVTSEESTVISSTLGERHVSVFLPTTPNPTSGFLLAVRRDRLRDIDLTTEEAMKIIVSGGAIDQKESIAPARGGGALDMDRLLSRVDEEE